MSGRVGKRARTVATLRSLAEAGHTASEAAELIGYERAYVLLLARESGFAFAAGPVFYRPRIGSTERSQKMAALYKGGKTLEQVGAEFGVTRERVRQIISRQEGIQRRDGGIAKRADASRLERAARRDARHYATHGCSYAQYRWLLKVKRALPRFNQQRFNAGRRGIGWELNLWQWWTIWEESGHWAERGRGQGYVMCRKGDVGPYAVGNVLIAKAIENSSVQPHNPRRKHRGLPIGVRPTKSGRYAAHRMVDGISFNLGTFDSPELAHAAYLAFAPSYQVAA